MSDVGRVSIWFDDLLSMCQKVSGNSDLTEDQLKEYLALYGYPERYRNHICRGCKGCS